MFKNKNIDFERIFKLLLKIKCAGLNISYSDISDTSVCFSIEIIGIGEILNIFEELLHRAL